MNIYKHQLMSLVAGSIHPQAPRFRDDCEIIVGTSTEYFPDCCIRVSSNRVF